MPFPVPSPHAFGQRIAPIVFIGVPAGGPYGRCDPAPAGNFPHGPRRARMTVARVGVPSWRFESGRQHCCSVQPLRRTPRRLPVRTAVFGSVFSAERVPTDMHPGIRKHNQPRQRFRQACQAAAHGLKHARHHQRRRLKRCMASRAAASTGGCAVKRPRYAARSSVSVRPGSTSPHPGHSGRSGPLPWLLGFHAADNPRLARSCGARCVTALGFSLSEVLRRLVELLN